VRGRIAVSARGSRPDVAAPCRRHSTTAEDGPRAGTFVHPREARAIDRARYAAARVRLRPALVYGEEPTLVALEPLGE